MPESSNLHSAGGGTGTNVVQIPQNLYSVARVLSQGSSQLAPQYLFLCNFATSLALVSILSLQNKGR